MFQTLATKAFCSHPYLLTAWAGLYRIISLEIYYYASALTEHYAKFELSLDHFLLVKRDRFQSKRSVHLLKAREKQDLDPMLAV